MRISCHNIKQEVCIDRTGLSVVFDLGHILIGRAASLATVFAGSTASKTYHSSKYADHLHKDDPDSWVNRILFTPTSTVPGASPHGVHRLGPPSGFADHADYFMVIRHMRGGMDITVYNCEVPEAQSSEEGLLQKAKYLKTTSPGNNVGSSEIMSKSKYYHVRLAQT